MRNLVVSDLHSNWVALRAVIGHVRRKRIDRIVCLGDFVGYGAQPNQVVDAMRLHRSRKFYVRGNHDRVAVALEEGLDFNSAARSAALWTRERLSNPNRRFLENLPKGPIERDGVAICHGSPLDEDEYIFTAAHAEETLRSYPSKASVVLHGHTHLPMIFSVRPDGGVEEIRPDHGQVVKLRKEFRHLINPGSVGQPRDRHPEASCMIFDDDRMTVQCLRVAYDVAAAQASIVKAGLPKMLADRLALGM